ncbi:MAG: DUF402 domain-containing protein [Ktedonobacteraceae bacterium]|nr:DUF402 domain-containing protein [Ktedonobacteraceae bacterium]
MITVFKLNIQHQVKMRYQAEVIERRPDGVILLAEWTLPARDFGYTRFEPGDRFTEYYYTDRWFDILEIASADGKLKGWYCDIAEPALIEDSQIRQVDLELDVWVSTEGKTLILDEDEFEASPLSEVQREGARRGLQALLKMLEAREDAFSSLP